MAATVHPLTRKRAAAVAYLRVAHTTPTEADQRDAVTKAAAARGVTLADVLVDNDILQPRTQANWRRLLEGMASESWSTVILYDLPETQADLRQFASFMDLADASRIELVAAAGPHDLSTPAGRAFLRAVSQHAVEEHRLATQRRSAARGVNPAANRAGARPFGFEADGFTIRADEAQVLRDAAAYLLAGGSQRQLEQRLRAAGVRSATGKQLTASVLKRALLSPRAAGQRVNDTGRRVKAKWPPILDRATQRRLETHLAKTAGDRGGDTRKRYVLTGLLRCGNVHDFPDGRRVCDAVMSHKGASAGAAYVCRQRADGSACGSLRVVAEPLEALVTERVLAVLSRPEARRSVGESWRAAGMDDRSSVELAGQIVVREDQLRAAAADAAAGVLDPVSWGRFRQRINAELDDLRMSARAIARLEALPDPSPEGLAQWWVDADVPARRDLISTVLRRVVVLPGRRGQGLWLDERLRFDWR